MTVAAVVSSTVTEVKHTVDAAPAHTAPAAAPRRRHAAAVVADGDAQLAALLAELGVAE